MSVMAEVLKNQIIESIEIGILSDEELNNLTESSDEEISSLATDVLAQRVSIVDEEYIEMAEEASLGCIIDL